MLYRKTAFAVLALLLLAVPCFAGADTSSTFVKALGGVLVAQHQGEGEKIGATFQVEGIRLVYWNVGTTFHYWNTARPGGNSTKYAARIVVFGKNPNVSELKGEWIPFLTLGGIEFYDSEDEKASLATADFDGSVGVIGPLAGMNLVAELGGKRMSGKTYWWIGAGFFFVPKL